MHKKLLLGALKLQCLFLFCSISSGCYSQANEKSSAVTHYYTRAAGNYSNTTTVWSQTSYTGAACSCAPPCNIPSNTFIHINKSITASCNPLDIGSNATFALDPGGSFALTGGANVTGTGSLSVAAGSSLSVSGSLSFGGGGDATINGHVTVTGTVSIGSSATSVCGSGMLIANAFTGNAICGALSFGILPVELIDFNAICLIDGVQLNWSTASEHENNYFVIEKSNDGKNWEVISQVNSNGNSSMVNNYVHTDFSKKNDLSYYRLSQVDMNGASTVFKMIDISCNEKIKDHMLLFPNPSIDELNVLLTVNEPVKDCLIRIYNNSGSLVFEIKIDLETGLNTQVLPVDFEPGSYTVIVSSDKIVIPGQKLVVIKP